jgi:hypothetical protein
MHRARSSGIERDRAASKRDELATAVRLLLLYHVVFQRFAVSRLTPEALSPVGLSFTVPATLRVAMRAGLSLALKRELERGYGEGAIQ